MTGTNIHILEMDSFKCIQESDEWSDADEVYFPFAATDGTRKETGRTKTFESVDSGDSFDIKKIIWADPLAHGGLAVDITCWEEDDANFDKAMNIANEFVERMFPEMSKFDLYALGAEALKQAMGEIASTAIDVAKPRFTG
ncbi:hypothetical protein [Streptomyces millisiae]|uniref:Uncharacterized protein n=1 Tax=Streptomyces millisiae TaxID=3075542 RepID=A0ABU2LLT6_9ACTN|nr:hypothetical protein [Streptomyces sp. DSM 44918]MDT0318547.1 hypothetical protein [Streptomyces sp. DSM 44918]